MCCNMLYDSGLLMEEISNQEQVFDTFYPQTLKEGCVKN